MDRACKRKKYGKISKDEFPELTAFLYWGRQAVGVVAGLVAGVLALQGIVGFASFGAVAVVVPMLWYGATGINVDVDEFGSQALMTEGLGPSFGLFLLCWITTYTTLYTDV